MFSSKKVIRSASNSQLSSFLESLEEPEEIQEEEMEELLSEDKKRRKSRKMLFLFRKQRQRTLP